MILQNTYETRKELRLVRAKVMVTRRKAFETNWELDIARADNVLDLEIRELSVEAKLLNDTCVFTRRQARILARGVSNHEGSDKVTKDQPSSDLAPVTTILPEAKIRAVVLGSRMRIMTAAKRFGLYSAFLA